MEDPVIPNKLYFQIGEVSRLLKLQPYVLRFWEREFPMLSPAKGANGRRMYRKKDVEMVLTIRNLLYHQGFTIAGARKTLHRRNSNNASQDLRLSEESVPSKALLHPTGWPSGSLSELKRELENILTILKRRC